MPSADVIATPVGRSATPDLDPAALPSWLPAESAQIVLGNRPAPALPASPSTTPQLQPQVPSEGNSVWAQQTYQPTASKASG